MAGVLQSAQDHLGLHEGPQPRREAARLHARPRHQHGDSPALTLTQTLTTDPDQSPRQINLAGGRGVANRPTVINCFAGDMTSRERWWADWKAIVLTLTLIPSRSLSLSPTLTLTPIPSPTLSLTLSQVGQLEGVHV